MGFCQPGEDGGGSTSATGVDDNQNAVETVSKTMSSGIGPDQSIYNDYSADPNNGNELIWAWECNITYTYSKNTKMIDRSTVNVTKPFAVPSRQSIVDYNGKYYTILRWAESYTPDIQWINLSSFTAIISFVTKEMWNPGAFRIYTGNDIMTKTCVAR